MLCVTLMSLSCWAPFSPFRPLSVRLGTSPSGFFSTIRLRSVTSTKVVGQGLGDCPIWLTVFLCFVRSVNFQSKLFICPVFLMWLPTKNFVLVTILAIGSCPLPVLNELDVFGLLESTYLAVLETPNCLPLFRGAHSRVPRLLMLFHSIGSVLILMPFPFRTHQQAFGED